jgi:signal peptidase II
MTDNDLTTRTGPAPPASWLWGPYAALGLAVAVPTFLLDQANKWWFIKGMDLPNRGEIPVLPFLSLKFTLNTGISYSLFDMPTYEWQLTLAAIAVLASLALWVWLVQTASNRLMAVSLGLIIGGALGNALDRVLLQGVADFYKLHWADWSWYIFNIADVAIVAGVLGLLYDLYLTSRNDAAKSS